MQALIVKVGFFVVPSLKGEEKIMRKATRVFCKMYSLPEIRKAFAEWMDQVAGMSNYFLFYERE
jgi:hypothetical protein